MDSNSSGAFIDKLSAFIRQQCAAWPELSKARDLLSQVLTRKYFLSDLHITLQHNPQRIKSTSSQVDKKSIEKRPCFLCQKNLYPKQMGLPYEQDWLILNNPFPIFTDHLVVSHQSHHPQLIEKALETMICFVRDTDFSFTAFYNGPACGASAPDHLHFQACPRGGLPITAQAAQLSAESSPDPRLFPVEKNKTGKSFTVSADGRALFLCITRDPGFLFERLNSVLGFLKDKKGNPEEPMINLIISGMGKSCMGIIFPRKAHRPSCYDKKGRERIIISPGAVDMGGLFILPRKKDYDNMNKEIIIKIFSEVCCSQEIFEGLSFQYDLTKK